MSSYVPPTSLQKTQTTTPTTILSPLRPNAGMLWISAPHFTAGADVDGGIVKGAIAPIIRYMHGWPIERVRSYCRSKRWELWECGVDLAVPH
ncbi:hypothetical protein ACQR1W_17960 [Bradyrhizobium sp. HKCCYLS1011]|uniref:hypothetical protein n=1 Tax=Bradyrhizobium sp. HKCCYLS1011 TaxID=3420733 RepID=UPI003EBB866D